MRTLVTASHSRQTPLAWSLAVALGLASGTGATTPMPRAADAVRQMAVRDAEMLHPQAGVLWPVSNCNDAGAGSLRAAAGHAIDGDGIDLSSLACSTISVTSGAITLHDVELIGPGAAALTIDGGGNQGRRIFNHIGHGGGLTIRDVTVHGAKYQSNAGQGGACLRSDSGPLRIHDSVFDGCLAFAPTGTNGAVRGGAIAAYGSSVVLSNVTLTNNQARSASGAALGGALYAFGDSVLIGDSTISNNSATAASASAIKRGGGVFAHGSAGFSRTTIDGNLSEGSGGGAWIEGGGHLMFSTVSNNLAVGGGAGIAFLGAHGPSSSAIHASTISDNETQASTQSEAGALYLNTAFTTITSCTIAGNIESNIQGIAYGAGILLGPATGDSLTMVSTIVHGNHLRDATAGADIGGPLGATIGGDHNLIGVAYVHVPVDTIRFSDPLLGPLQDNGGPTWTRMPAANSPVIDHGNAQDQVFDQREYPRVVGVAADIGAVEAPSDVIFADGFE
ncbi:MAG: hypothetical protein GXC76_14795 [Rhodanobacteraceae bacterium]|jgi:hypothetical protein|nr:hypothetical protein [Rhodanobacteraceae bacterium]